MITNSMSQKEMIEEMNKDFLEFGKFAVSTFSNKKYYKEAMKHEKPCTFNTVYWTSRRKNNYLIVPYSNGKADTKKYKGICWAAYIYYFDEHEKINAIMCTVDTPTVFFTSHLFDRYAERYLNDYTLGKKEVMAKFARNNLRYCLVPFNNPNYPNACIGKTKDGVVIGSVTDGIATLKTFITDDMLKGCELESINNSEKGMKIYMKKREQLDDMYLFLSEIL